MTICVAAIGRENGKEVIVFATDHMITTSAGEFEHPILKYRQIGTNMVAMLAGNPLIFEQLIKTPDTEDIDKVSMAIHKNFIIKRNEIITNEVFNVFGITHAEFKNYLHGPIQNPIMGQILEKVANFKLNTGILLVGFKNHDGQIKEINEFAIHDFRALNFHAIGSGVIQAENTLLFQKHAKEECLRTTLYDVYKAKRNAEVSVGVGQELELVLLRESGLMKISESDLAILDGIYSEELKYGRTHSKLRELSVGD